MLTKLQSATRIDEKIYGQVQLAHLGTPLQAYKGTLLRLTSIFCLFVSIISTIWFCYNLYAYLLFTPLAHKYLPFLASPPRQFDQYFWLEILHDSFWHNSIMDTLLILGFLLAFFLSLTGFTTKIYICTHGLLKIEKKEVETIHWNEIEKLYTSRGNVTSLLRKDDSRFTIDDLFYRQGANRKQSTLIANEASRVRLPTLLQQFEHRETISIGTLEARKRGLYRPDLLLPWKDIHAVNLRKGHLYVFAYQLKHVFAKKELIWSEWINDSTHLGLVDLPLFSALLEAIIERENKSQIERKGTHLS